MQLCHSPHTTDNHSHKNRNFGSWFSVALARKSIYELRDNNEQGPTLTGTFRHDPSSPPKLPRKRKGELAN